MKVIKSVKWIRGSCSLVNVLDKNVIRLHTDGRLRSIEPTHDDIEKAKQHFDQLVELLHNRINEIVPSIWHEITKK